MKSHRLALVAILLFASSHTHAADAPAKPKPKPVPPPLVAPQKGELSSAGMYVTVPLEARADHKAGLELPIPDKRITIANIPFDLVARPDVDNFFLKSAEWPDWKSDPSTYYAAYDKGPETPNDPRRPLFKIPVGDYSSAYLLAACENDAAYSPIVSFRIGAIDGARRVTMHDFSVTVPRFNETPKRDPNVLRSFPHKDGNVFLVRVPLGLALAQDFDDQWSLDVEVTKELHVAVRRPDPCRYQIRPLGLSSGVHIYGLTFARSPVQMKVTATEPGNVFNEPQKPMFRVDLDCSRALKQLTLEAVATDYYGTTTTVASEPFEVLAGAKLTREITVDAPKRGYYKLAIRVMNGRVELLRRETTMALLPKNDRQYVAESPFGTWDFCGTHFTPNDPDLTGPLYVKAGLRYGMFGYTPEVREKYGVLSGSEARDSEDLTKRLAKDPQVLKNILIFHEHGISGPHIMRTPDVFTGRSPYQLDEKEQQRFDTLWAEALATAKEARAKYPEAKLAFGNGNVHLLEEFMRHKFPSELFDSRGNEAGSFMRMPENQPLDFVANNAGLWMDRQVLDYYGYQDKPITQCYEIGYPNTNPGNLTMQEQADYFVRNMLHSLVWKMPLIRMGSITDMGNSYYHSNWGASGLCFARPNVSPKPSYVATATTTQQLDGATFTRVVPTGSTVVQAVEFKRRDGRFVTVAWTLRGSRLATFAAMQGSATAVDLMANELPLEATSIGLRLELTPGPCFITSAKPLGNVVLGEPTYEPRPTKEEKPFVVAKLGDLTDWEVENERSSELEFYNFESPRRKGNFKYESVADLNGEKKAIRVTPQLPVEGSKFLPMYSVLRHKQGVELPGVPTEIGLMVHGNGGWGRAIFELTDADGERFISIGAAAVGEPTRWMADWMPAAELERMKAMSISDWNTNDVRSRSRFNFDGWRYVRFPLPGQYPGEGYHWPENSQWKSSGDGVVNYPLTFKKLILELPENVLQFQTYAPPVRTDIAIKDLTVTYAPLKELK